MEFNSAAQQRRDIISAVTGSSVIVKTHDRPNGCGESAVMDFSKSSSTVMSKLSMKNAATSLKTHSVDPNDKTK